MRRIVKWLVVVCLAVPFAVIALYLATMRSGDAALYPATEDAERFPVVIADHGYHAGLIVQRADLARFAAGRSDEVLAAIVARYMAYEWIEFGWGDEQFYRFAPAISDVTVKMAFDALSGSNDATVLHVVGLAKPPEQIFTRSDLQRIALSEKGMEQVMAGISLTFARDRQGLPLELGEGIYGPSLFYKATGHYSLLNTCNTWIGDLLHAAGLAVSPVPSVASAGLLAELRWRNELPQTALSAP